MNIVLALALQPKVKLNPDITKLPGGDVAQGIADGIAAYSLVACIALFVIGAVTFVLSSRGSNVAYASGGRHTALVALVASLLIGGAPAIVNFFIGLGGQI